MPSFFLGLLIRISCSYFKKKKKKKESQDIIGFYASKRGIVGFWKIKFVGN